MRAVSAEFIKAVRSQNRQIAGGLYIADGENGLEITDELESYKIETVGAPFSTSMRKITLKILGTDLNCSNKIITPKIAVNSHSATLEPFEVTEVKVSLEDKKTEVIGYDAMVKTHKKFDSLQHSFPCSMSEFVKQIARVCRLELDENFELLGGELEIPIDYFAKISGIIYRDILKQIAEISGGVFFARNGKLAFSKMKNEALSTILTDFDLKKLTILESTKPINSLVLSRTPQEDNIYFRASNFDGANLSELKIANNEIIDKRRSDVAGAIFERISGIGWQGFKAETFGFCFFEPCDKIRFERENQTFESYVFNSILEVSTSLKESFETQPLTLTVTNYARASDTLKKIYNTEIAVDKQKQEIASIISQKEKLESETLEKFSRLDQTLTDFNYTLSKTGGLNLLKNSAFYSFDEKTSLPNFWAIRSLDNLAVENSAEARNKGAVSGRKITIRNDILAQTVAVASNFAGENQNFYSFSCRVKKPVIGSGKIEILDGKTVARTFEITEGTSFDWAEVKIEGILPQNNALSVKITANANSVIAFADLNLVNNKTASVWTQAQGEISNANLHIDEHGLIIKSSVNEGDYTAITPLEFSGYSKIGHNIQRVFTVNKDTTEVKKFKAEDEIDMSPIKIVAIKEGDKTGWAFVRNGGNQ